LFAIGLATASAYANDYAHIVVFGDSLSDTGNMAHLSEAKYGVRIPGPIADYTDGRLTDGYDTLPAAQKYFGVWIEQLAASMPTHPEVKNSLDGGTNYAYAFAFTGSGTTVLTFGPNNSLSVNIENMGKQVSDYLATKPKIDSNTLFVIWGGANDLLNAKSAGDIVNAAIQETLDIQRLIEAGGTQFLVLNLPPLGLTPRLNGSLTTSIPANAGAALFNSWLATGLSVLRDFYFVRRVAFFQVNVFKLLNQIAKSPGTVALTNVTDASQGNFSVDPDTYLFWDDLHPTTRGHNILAGAAMKAITSPQCLPFLLGCAATR
jgi:phospholipase/lecithinase/hemolysin